MHVYANPARFLKIAHPLTGWLFWAGALVTAAALGAGLFLAPQDYLQGDSVRIMYVHVPAAWLANGRVNRNAAASWRSSLGHPLTGIAGRALAVPEPFTPAASPRLAWGPPTWGTYWEWAADDLHAGPRSLLSTSRWRAYRAGGRAVVPISSFGSSNGPIRPVEGETPPLADHQLHRGWSSITRWCSGLLTSALASRGSSRSVVLMRVRAAARQNVKRGFGG